MPKQLKRSPTTSPSSSEPSKEFLLTKEIVTLIIKLATDGNPNQLLNLALVSKVFKEIALEILYGELVIEGGWEQLKKYARYKKKSRKGKELVQQQVETKSFELKLETIYPIPLTKSLETLQTIFNSFSTSLTSLSLFLPPSSHNPIPHLFSTESDNDQHQLSILSSLTELRSFKLEGGGGSEIWFHDLINLFSSWSKLRILELDCLVRGDCNKPLPLPSETIIPRLEKLVISKTTLNGKMIQFLLSNQKESLKWLEIPLPGTTSNFQSHTSEEEQEEEQEEEIEGKLAWKAIQGLFEDKVKAEGEATGSSSNNVAGGGSKLEVLKLTDRFWETTCAKKRKEALKLKKKKEETANKFIKTSGGVGVGGRGTDQQKKKETKVVTKQGGKSKKAQPQPDSDEDENDEIDELASSVDENDQQEAPAPPPPIVVFPPSPFLTILSSQNSLRSLLLTTAYLPSSPSSKSFKQLLPHLDNLVELTIEDTKQSGLREMVKKALIKKGKGSLKSLKWLVSVRIKKKKRKKASNTNPKGKGKVVTTKGKGKKKIHESDSESDDEEEDELASDDESDEDEDNGKVEQEESEESKRKKEMTKPELKFYEFCEKKGIKWRIQRDQ